MILINLYSYRLGALDCGEKWGGWVCEWKGVKLLRFSETVGRKAFIETNSEGFE